MDGKLTTDTRVGKRRIKIWRDITKLVCNNDIVTFQCDNETISIELNSFNKFEISRRVL